MKLIIDIPEEKYDAIKSDLYNTFPAEMKEWGLEAIRNGTPYETVTEFADRCRECGREKTLDKIRAEMHATAEMYEDGDYCLRDEWIDEIINEYKATSEDKK